MACTPDGPNRGLWGSLILHRQRSPGPHHGAKRVASLSHSPYPSDRSLLSARLQPWEGRGRNGEKGGRKRDRGEERGERGRKGGQRRRREREEEGRREGRRRGKGEGEGREEEGGTCGRREVLPRTWGPPHQPRPLLEVMGAGHADRAPCVGLQDRPWGPGDSPPPSGSRVSWTVPPL